MNTEVWQNLLSLESRDAVTAWFTQIHGRELSGRRSREIIAAARQAREFFRNSASSNFSVKPLLTFYGVASMSRSLTLLLQPHFASEEAWRGGDTYKRTWPRNGLMVEFTIRRCFERAQQDW